MLFAGGMLGAAAVLYDALAENHAPDPTALAFCGGMMGLPLWLTRDEKNGTA